MLSKDVPFYSERLLVQPGVTGWAQVSYPYGATVEDARRKLEYDLYYMKHMSVLLDIFILLYPGLILAVSIFGKTDDEIGRLWIPIMVPLFISVARESVALYKHRPYGFMVSSFVFVILVKNYHDFR